MFERVETPRLILRKPIRGDAETIFSRFSSNPEVTRLLSWPTHESIEATYAFIEASDEEWAQWPVGPYLIESREDGTLLGGTGLSFESAECASTGYVLARDSWGRGYATGALRAMVDISRKLAVVRLYAVCHIENLASQRVLEKCGLVCEGQAAERVVFPNFAETEPQVVLSYAVNPSA